MIFFILIITIIFTSQKLNVMTPFEQAVLQAAEGKLQTPSVSTSSGQINYFQYQLAVHKFYLSLMARGIQNRQVKLKELKHYYGLKGRTASDCLPQLERLIDQCNG
jgi:hypothetical protein